MKLYCPVCQKEIQDCECAELLKSEEDMAVLEAANLWVAAVESGRGGNIGKVEPNGFLWPLILAVREWRKVQ